MSKFNKVVVKKLEGRNLKRYPSQSTINQSHTTLLNPDKLENNTESPYAKKQLKTRSVSTLKDSILQPSSSPIPNVKFPTNLNPKLNLSSSFQTNPKLLLENRSNSTKKLRIFTKNPADAEVYLIDLKLQELTKKHKESGFSTEIFQQYQQCFDEIISKDTTFGQILSKIKLAYSELIIGKTGGLEDVTKMKSEIFEFSKRLNKEIEENKLLYRKVQKFSKENAEMGRTLEERENNFRSLQEYLLKVTNINIDEVPQDKVTWKVLVAENKTYADLCAKLKKKIKVMKKKENRLMKLFWGLKQKGYPVEEMYEKTGRKKEYINNVSITELSENEPIYLEPSKNLPKPGNVPCLHMSKVEPNSFSDDHKSDSSEEELCLD